MVLNKTATLDLVTGFKPDAVILGTGALPDPSEIDGKAANEVVNNWEILSGEGRVGNRVVIIGGGLVGCETAEAIAEVSKNVSVVEKLEELAPDTFELLKRPLVKRLNEKGVKVYLGIKAEKITPEGLMTKTIEGERFFLEADQIVLTTGSVSSRDLAFKLRDEACDIFEIGDCREPRRILEAIYEGTAIALDI